MSTLEEQFESMMSAKPTRHHAWLERLVGEWTYEVDTPPVAGEEPRKVRCTETVRSLGGLWTIAEGVGEMPGGGEARVVMTLGYDPRRERFVGTFTGSMMDHLWVYDGELDDAGRVLTLHAIGPGADERGNPPKFKDVIELLGDDERTLTGYVLTPDGAWQQIMRAHYRRR